MSIARRSRKSTGAAILAAALSIASRGHLEAAAIREEVFAITSGWNLIHISGDPITKDPRTVLSNMDWTSLWAWVPPSTGQSRGRWAVVHRNQPSFLDTLGTLVGSTSYALLAGSPGTLRVKCGVVPRHSELRGGAYELHGPAVPSSGPPTLSRYFSRPDVEDHITAVYELAAGAYRRVQASDLLRAGAAYWVLADQDVKEPDPIRVRTGLGGITFDSQVTLAEVELDVGASPQARQLTVRATPSADGQSTAAWLRVSEADAGLPPEGMGGGAGTDVTIDVPADQSRVRLFLAAESQGVVPAGSPDQGAVVEVALPSGLALVSAELIPPIRQGIWIGEATFTGVERASIHGGGSAPAANITASILLDIPASGQPRLLPCVQVDAQRDGRRRTYRLEAVLFQSPIALTGTLAADGTSGVLAGSVRLPPDHPLNPYRHRYHPEHGAGYDITRSIELRFGEAAPVAPGIENPLATVGVLSGVYEEEITGLTPEPIRVRGSFRLRQTAEGTVQPCAGP